MGFQHLRTIPTNRGRVVSVARASDAGLVLLKRAETEEWRQDLRTQVRHYEVMASLLDHDSPYPEVLLHTDDQMVLRFYPHGSLDDLSLGDDHDLVLTLTSHAVEQLFSIAGRRPAGLEDRPDEQLARSFLVDQAEARARRLHRALADDADARRALPRGELDRAVGWAEDGRLRGVADRLGPPWLGLAAHGDFGLNNLLLGGPPASTAPLVFIDTRGLWCAGFPWWDPVMDLATLVAFHCRIEPALSRAGELPPAHGTARGRLAEPEVHEAVRTSPAARCWQNDDPCWRERFEVEIAIRLLGNVSVQILTAPRHGPERAAVVWGLLLAQVPVVEGILRQLERGTR